MIAANALVCLSIALSFKIIKAVFTMWLRSRIQQDRRGSFRRQSHLCPAYGQQKAMESTCDIKRTLKLNRGSLIITSTTVDLLCVCKYVCIYLPSIIKMWLHIYKFVKSRIDKNNNICDVKHITTYTKLVYHSISDSRDSLKKLLKVLFSIRMPVEV